MQSTLTPPTCSRPSAVNSGSEVYSSSSTFPVVRAGNSGSTSCWEQIRGQDASITTFGPETESKSLTPRAASIARNSRHSRSTSLSGPVITSVRACWQLASRWNGIVSAAQTYGCYPILHGGGQSTVVRRHHHRYEAVRRGELTRCSSTSALR